MISQVSIVFESPDFIVINKPAGLLTHPVNEKDASPSVVSWLIEKYPEIKGVGEDLPAGRQVLRPGIVHRLDKETSGLMIIARTQEAFIYFKKQFQEHRIKKTYLALVYGILKNKEGTIDSPLGKIGAKQTTRIHGTRDLKERSAVTDYKVLKEYGDYSLLEVSPQTGRTHQIRVHLKSIGHPIVGDLLYGSPRGRAAARGIRLFLHAQKLAFTSPTGQAFAFEADLPPELETYLAGLDKK